MKPKQNLIDLTEDEYKKAKASGMFWVWYPEATGSYFRDVIQKISDLNEEEYNEYLLKTSPIRKAPQVKTIKYSDKTDDFLEEYSQFNNKEKQKHSHYFKEWFGKIDIYRILSLFNVTCPCLQHAVKKLLCTGNRGHKDFRKDIEDVIDTLNRKLEMMDEDESLK